MHLATVPTPTVAANSKNIACETGGVFTAVPDNGDLNLAMASYYKVLAAGMPATERDKISWSNYHGAFTPVEFMSACKPAFKPAVGGAGDFADLLGVTCMDLNVLANLPDLREEGDWSTFYQTKVIDEACYCPTGFSLNHDQLEAIRASMVRAREMSLLLFARFLIRLALVCMFALPMLNPSRRRRPPAGPSSGGERSHHLIDGLPFLTQRATFNAGYIRRPDVRGWRGNGRQPAAHERWSEHVRLWYRGGRGIVQVRDQARVAGRSVDLRHHRGRGHRGGRPRREQFVRWRRHVSAQRRGGAGSPSHQRERSDAAVCTTTGDRPGCEHDADAARLRPAEGACGT